MILHITLTHSSLSIYQDRSNIPYLQDITMSSVITKPVEAQVITMSSVTTTPVKAQDIKISFVTIGTPVEDLSKIISYPWTSYDEGSAVYSTTESFMFGFLNEFSEASHIFPIKCGLYTDENPSVPNKNEDHTCKDTDLHNLTIKCAEDHIAVNDKGFMETQSKVLRCHSVTSVSAAMLRRTSWEN